MLFEFLPCWMATYLVLEAEMPNNFANSYLDKIKLVSFKEKNSLKIRRIVVANTQDHAILYN